jgi:hypothetical protein
MKPTTLKAQSKWIEQRRAELGQGIEVLVVPNSGHRRTLEKRALLQKLQEIRADKPDALQFFAKY